MDRISYIDHKGNTILYINFSKCHPREIQSTIDEVKKIVAHQSPGTLLTLTNVTDMMFDKTTSQKMKDLSAHNGLFAKAEAVIGATGILKVMFDSIIKTKKNKMKILDTLPAAKDWLVEQ
ncbi:MAG: hypothetical protein PHH44_07380 [bacterium]|jgi:hypothetical protein|nr:hypothetical protein [bacterium]